MVKFQIVSDIHIEREDNPNVEDYIVPSAPILIMAGDIGHLEKEDQLYNFLKKVCSQFEVVIYVLGNHEYYILGDAKYTMESLFRKAKEMESKIPNLYILNRDSVTVGNVCIAGCTLWSYNYNYIPPYIVKIPEMTSQKYMELYRKDLHYLKSIISHCKEHKLKLLVVTHHCPTYKVLDGKRAYDRFKSLYVSHLDILLNRESVHTWICGHIHRNFDFITDGGTRLVSNQRGKPKDNIGDFRKTKIITV